MIRDKTDLLAVRLGSYRKSQFLCHITYLILVIISYRHQSMGKLVLGQVIEHIALVLLRVEGLVQQPPAAASVIA